MKLITGPAVYLLGRQTLVGDELARFLADHDFAEWTTDSPCDAQTLVEVAARSCYQSFKTGRPHAAHIAHLREVNHLSTYEHAVWNILVTGVSRSLSHELVRHRIGISPSQLSQRYVDEGAAEYVVPPDLRVEVQASLYMEAVSPRGDEPPAMTEAEADARWPEVASLAAADIDDYYRAAHAGDAWRRAVAHSHAAYVGLSDHLAGKAAARGLEKTEARKFARQSARSVLPNATETKIFLTANARALRHAIALRCSRHADPEIRVLFGRVWEVMTGEAPDLFAGFRRVDLGDGTFELSADGG